METTTKFETLTQAMSYNIAANTVAADAAAERNSEQLRAARIAIANTIPQILAFFAADPEGECGRVTYYDVNGTKVTVTADDLPALGFTA